MLTLSTVRQHGNKDFFSKRGTKSETKIQLMDT